MTELPWASLLWEWLCARGAGRTWPPDPSPEQPPTFPLCCWDYSRALSAPRLFGGLAEPGARIWYRYQADGQVPAAFISQCRCQNCIPVYEGREIAFTNTFVLLTVNILGYRCE
jgi:hypothetical protein